jgi:hypothetical protein
MKSGNYVNRTRQSATHQAFLESLALTRQGNSYVQLQKQEWPNSLKFIEIYPSLAQSASRKNQSKA